MKDLKSVERERLFFYELVQSRFNTLGKKRPFCVSVPALIKDVFGVEVEIELETAKILYLHLRGDKKSIKDLKFSHGYSKKITKLLDELDVESIEDFCGKVFLWVLQQKKILLLPTDEFVTKGMGLKQIHEEIV